MKLSSGHSQPPPSYGDLFQGVTEIDAPYTPGSHQINENAKHRVDRRSVNEVIKDRIIIFLLVYQLNFCHPFQGRVVEVELTLKEHDKKFGFSIHGGGSLNLYPKIDSIQRGTY